MASGNISVNDFGSLSFGDSQCRGRLTELFTKVAIDVLGFFLIAGFCNALHYILRPFSQPRITSDIFVCRLFLSLSLSNKKTALVIFNITSYP